MSKSTDRKLGILKAAARIFLDRGFDGTSMNFVADGARVTKPGLYYHFKSKRELLFAIMSYAMDALERETQAVVERTEDPVERLRQLLAAHAHMLISEEDGSFTMLVIDETKNLEVEHRRQITQRKRAYFELVRTTLEELRRQGQLRDTDTSAATFCILGMVMWISKWYHQQGPLSADQVVDQVTQLALAAVLRDA